MKKIQWFYVALLFCLIGGGTTTAQNAAPYPPQSAEDIRQTLFQAQLALMSGDASLAQTEIDKARQIYETDIAPQFIVSASDTAEKITALFGQMSDAVSRASPVALAAWRGQLWTALLDGASATVFTAIHNGDAATAQLWLPLRDFRVSTRFSRPNAEATLAIYALANAQITPDVALQRVRADLWDTYQAQLNRALADAEEARDRGFALRWAEESGRAAGYFDILAPAYAEAHGPDAMTHIRAQFDALLTAALADDVAHFEDARQTIDDALANWRAAPLAEAEMARRAGQLIRFVGLIGIEYGRGVRNGIVTNDIEIQEALAFHQGALAAFLDIQPMLSQRDTAATSRIREGLDRALAQIRAVADPAELQATVDKINADLIAVIPAEWLESTSDSDIDVILSVLDQVANALEQGDYQRAESARLEAYAILELGVEQRLLGFAPQLAMRVESLFWQGTADSPGLAVLLAEKAPLDRVRATLRQIETTFDEVRLVLDSARGAPAAVASNAAIIVFREGLEAVLILASLLASLRTAEQKRYRRPLLMGGFLALVATVATWWGATRLLNILLPLGEKLEAIVSLIAIGVLLLITNWFFHKAYWVGWMANFHARKQQLVKGRAALGVGQLLGLVLLGFTSIYREGFETVLFLQSLILEAGIPVVLQGVVIGFVATCIVGFITFRLQMRLPYKKMLIATGILIGGVLLVMVGNTVHVMQVVGWLPITPIQGLYFPFWMGQWFGLFATWQGIIAQTAAATFVIGSYFLAEHQNKRHRQSAGQVAQQSI